MNNSDRPTVGDDVMQRQQQPVFRVAKTQDPCLEERAPLEVETLFCRFLRVPARFCFAT